MLTSNTPASFDHARALLEPRDDGLEVQGAKAAPGPGGEEKRRAGRDNYYGGSIVGGVGSTHELGPLEMQVLGLLGAEPVAVSAVRGKLAGAGADLAYTTVMTVLGRLYSKGLVERTRDGNRYLYAATQRAGRVSEGIMARASRALFDRDRARPILALLDDAELSDGDLKALRRAIDARLKDRGKAPPAGEAGGAGKTGKADKTDKTDKTDKADKVEKKA
jgi:BlaI family transcriptional regulator, penicillinase repressor